MLVIRTKTLCGKPPQEFRINFEEKTIETVGKKFHLVKIEQLGVPYEFVALVYDTYMNTNFYINSEGKIIEMIEE